jgi:putative transposase
MPWCETSPMEQRLQLIHEYETGLWTMTELALEYGISRKTAYKWLERYLAAGAEALADRSRRPHGSPHATPDEIVAAIIQIRQRHPRWGAKKLRAVLHRRHPRVGWPARSTICDVLKARGLVRPRARRPRVPVAPRPPLAPMTAPNDVWTTDFKGEFRTGDGRYCYPLTLRDGCSRYVLRCDGLPRRTTDATRRRFEHAFAEYGLPDRMRSDNGSPFASAGLGGLSQLSVWWIRLGIVPERIAPGHPEQNGSHEQFHSVLKAETARPPATTLAAQQRRFTTFCAEYNHERPHEALADDTPAMHYHASRRPLPARVPPLDYAGHLEVRLVARHGCVSWGGTPVFLTTALAGEYVAFEEVDDGCWTIRFADVALGRFDERHRVVRPLAPYKVGRSASCAGSAPVDGNTE